MKIKSKILFFILKKQNQKSKPKQTNKNRHEKVGADFTQTPQILLVYDFCTSVRPGSLMFCQY